METRKVFDKSIHKEGIITGDFGEKDWSYPVFPFQSSRSNSHFHPPERALCLNFVFFGSYF